MSNGNGDALFAATTEFKVQAVPSVKLETKELFLSGPIIGFGNIVRSYPCLEVHCIPRSKYLTYLYLLGT